MEDPRRSYHDTAFIFNICSRPVFVHPYLLILWRLRLAVQLCRYLLRFGNYVVQLLREAHLCFNAQYQHPTLNIISCLPPPHNMYTCWRGETTEAKQNLPTRGITDQNPNSSIPIDTGTVPIQSNIAIYSSSPRRKCSD